jgi:hypothetical protein
MATHEDAQLILKLYELRRDPVMREARDFVAFKFFPESAQDIKDLLFDKRNPVYGAYWRQVTTYWDMAAALVNHGTLDEALFFDTNTECFAVFAKLEPFCRNCATCSDRGTWSTSKNSSGAIRTTVSVWRACGRG